MSHFSARPRDLSILLYLINPRGKSSTWRLQGEAVECSPPYGRSTERCQKAKDLAITSSASDQGHAYPVHPVTTRSLDQSYLVVKAYAAVEQRSLRKKLTATTNSSSNKERTPRVVQAVLSQEMKKRKCLGPVHERDHKPEGTAEETMRETMRLTRNDASPTAHNPNERVNGHAYPTGARSTHTHNVW